MIEPEETKDTPVELAHMENEPTHATAPNYPVDSVEKPIEPLEQTPEPTEECSAHEEPTLIESTPVTDSVSERVNEYLDSDASNHPATSHGAAWWVVVLAFVLGIAAGATMMWFALPQSDDSEDEEMLMLLEMMHSPDSVAVIGHESAEPAPRTTEEERYDTVTSSRYLTTMAREYYGGMEFWVYIYDANRDVLGHPDRISPGTRVRIPRNLPTDAQARRQAVKMADDIYRRAAK